MPSIAILGPGGVGGFLAGAFERAGQPVRLIAREQTAAELRRLGRIRVESVRFSDDFSVTPHVVTELDVATDLLFVATKWSGLSEGLERVRTEPTTIVPLLNGLDHLAALRERFGPAAVAGTIRIEADRPEPGRIVQTSPFLRVDLASDDPAAGERLDWVAALLDAAEVPARIGRSEAQIMWEKLVRLNALACTTTAADRPLGFIRDDPDWRAALEACVSETVAVGRAEGAELDETETRAELDAAHAALGSSMQRDVAAGREPELDAIPGAVLRAAGRHGLECPTVCRLAIEIAQRAGVAPPRGV